MTGVDQDSEFEKRTAVIIDAVVEVLDVRDLNAATFALLAVAFETAFAASHGNLQATKICVLTVVFKLFLACETNSNGESECPR